MLRQSEIMHELAQMAFMASKGDYDELILEVRLDMPGGHISSKCWQSVNGKIEYLSLWDTDPEAQLFALSRELHGEMKKQAGGELVKFTITMDSEGTARAKFEYGEPQSLL